LPATLAGGNRPRRILRSTALTLRSRYSPLRLLDCCIAPCGLPVCGARNEGAQPPPITDLIGECVVLYSIFILIVDVIASMLTGVLLLRFWMQVVRVRPPANLGQFVFQLSDWLVKPIRKLLPGLGGYDWASLFAAFLVVLLSILASVGVTTGFVPELVFWMSLLRFVSWILYGFMALLIVEAIFSWVNPHAPLAPFVQALTQPLLRPLRRIVPLIGSVDLSPLVALILLQIAQKLISALIFSMI
jgi:YggT family protein